ncbi:MAG TPA: hypothetical protein VGN86_17505, partial [Pyrinomonadaceae bacterium]|nr:hypothetical protein [Pyrinomonadaceae bacterium]
MLANHRLLSPVFLLMLVVCVIAIALRALAGVGHGGGRGDTVAAADARLADGLAAWEQVYSV